MDSLKDQLLSISWDNDNDLAILAPCTKLEELEIRDGEGDPTPVEPEYFLPNLKKLVVDRCLGDFSRAFESARPTLTEVHLNCCHFGLACYSGSGPSGDEWELVSKEWEEVANMWPNIEDFTFIHENEELTFLKVRDVFPRLNKLKSLKLTAYWDGLEMDDLEESDKKELQSIRDDFWNLPASIPLRFEEDVFMHECQYRS